MTPNSLMKSLQDLPEELKDVDMEYITEVIEIDDEFSIRGDEYIGTILWNAEKKEVLLCSNETFEKAQEAGIF